MILAIVECLWRQWVRCWLALGIVADSCLHCPKFVPRAPVSSRSAQVTAAHISATITTWMPDADLEQLLASYYRMCAEAGVEPLPDDEAREQARYIGIYCYRRSRSRSGSIDPRQINA